MATYYARKAGNINAADVWATTPSGTAAAVTFASGDVLVANSFAIAVNVDTNLGATGQVRNDTTGGATNGGGFTLASGVTLTANVYGNANGTSANCVIFNSTTPSIATIVAGTIAAGSNNSAVENANTGTLTITVSGTVGNGTGTNGYGVRNSSTGTIYLTASGGIFGGSGQTSYGVLNNSTGNVFITGNVTGGTHTSNPNGVQNNSNGIVEITGTATGGTSSGIGAVNFANGTLRVTKAVGNGFGPGTTGLAATVGVAGGNVNSITTVEQIEFGALGQSPTSGAVRLVANGSNNANFYTTTGGRKTLIDATVNAAMPAASDVRSGVSYASGAFVGSCAVPAAGSVALGVPVDNTTGTAVLSQANVRTALGMASANLDTQLAPLTNLDAPVSSRLAPSGTLSRVTLVDTVTTLTNYTSPDNTSIAAIKAKTDNLPAAPAAVSNIPTAAQNASAVRTELTTELGRLDASVSSRLAPSGTLATVTNLTNAPASVTPADIWDYSSRSLTSGAAPSAVAIRQEMDANSTKLANLDAAISTRATPANIPSADIAAIKAKTDALNTDRLSQTATTAIVGALLAQANS